MHFSWSLLFRYFASSTSNGDSLSCLDALAQNETQSIINEKEPSSSVDSGLGNELDENEKENIEFDDHEIENDSGQDDKEDINISDDNDANEMSYIRTFAVDEVSAILTSDEGLDSKSQQSKRRLFTSERIETKRPKISTSSTSIDVPDTPTDTEDCFIVKSTPSTLKCKLGNKIYYFILKASYTSNELYYVY